MQEAEKVAIADLNDCITCKLCRGYFVDATTIIECLHTFCRSCIVRYLETNKYCPICDVQVHKTKPLLNIRPDKIVQDVVYKLVPRLYQNESKRRRSFYDTHPEAKPSVLEESGATAYEHILVPEESLCLRLNYHGSSEIPRYLRCPAAVSISHLQKLLRAKYDLSEHHRVEIMYNQDCLNPNLTLMDVAYIYSWKRKSPIDLTYRIYERKVKKPKLEETTNDHPKDTPQLSQQPQPNNQQIDNLSNNNNISNNSTSNSSNWKEVQLRISESGEMSIIQDDNNSSLLDMLEKNENAITGESKNDEKVIENNQFTEDKETEKSVVENKSSASENKSSTPQKSEKEVLEIENSNAVTQKNTPDNTKTPKTETVTISKNTTKTESTSNTAKKDDITNAETNVKEKENRSISNTPYTEENSTKPNLKTPKVSTESTPSVSAPITVPKKELPGLKFIGKPNIADTFTTYSSKKSLKNNNTNQTKPPTTNSDLKTVLPLVISCHGNENPIHNDVIMNMTSTAPASLNCGITTMVFSTINESKCSTKSSDDVAPQKMAPKLEKTLKRKMVDDGKSEEVIPSKIPKQTILNHSIGLLNLSNNHPLKKHSTKFINNRNGSENLPKQTPKLIINRGGGGSLKMAPNVTTVTDVITSRGGVGSLKMTPNVTTVTDVMISRGGVGNLKMAPNVTTVTDVLINRGGVGSVKMAPNVATVTDVGVLNKSLQLTSSSNPGSTSRPGTPSSFKVTVGQTNKLLTTTNTACYMPKSNYSPVINVPKLVANSGNSKGIVGNIGESTGRVENTSATSSTSTKTILNPTSYTAQPTTNVSSICIQQSLILKPPQKQPLNQQAQSQKNQQSQSPKNQPQNPQSSTVKTQQPQTNRQSQTQKNQPSQISQQQSQLQKNQQSKSPVNQEENQPQSHSQSQSTQNQPQPVLNQHPQPHPTQNQQHSDVQLQKNQQQPIMTSANSKPPSIKTKPSTPIGYKTLRDPPKSWNSQISKANLTKAAPNNAKYSDLKSVRPAKFFKGRNNMPRYLGNPASGVKPMYQVHVSPEKNQNHDNGNANNVKIEKSEIKKHSIVKIDPKTLKPISEKAPEMSNLSNVTSSLCLNNQNNHELRLNPQELKLNSSVMGDLKINTSSVSIFNPLKLQSSPKSDRRSPKSPHSPKVKTTLNCSNLGAGNAPTTSFHSAPVSSSAPQSHPLKRPDKTVNQLNFTPANPFVPNLASPTLNPSPFLYPHAPAGFPSYDPRVMAAYHSLWYGRSAMAVMGEAMGVGGVLGVGGFDMAAAVAAATANKGALSPKMMQAAGGGGSVQGQHSPGLSPKQNMTPPQLNIHQAASRAQNIQLLSKSPNSRKNRADQASKNEKSLENTVEKLTQSKAKELGLLNHKIGSKVSAKVAHKNETKDVRIVIDTSNRTGDVNKSSSACVDNVTKQKTSTTTTNSQDSGGKTNDGQTTSNDRLLDVSGNVKSEVKEEASVEQSSRIGSDVKTTSGSTASDTSGGDKGSEREKNNDVVSKNDVNKDAESTDQISGSLKSKSGSSDLLSLDDLSCKSSCKDGAGEGRSSSGTVGEGEAKQEEKTEGKTSTS